ncbi:MAG: hypothetical protein ABIP55_10760 [Tepidisphaeraceae bacterium]
MAVLPPNNALAWAHFRLRGGWVRSLTWTGGAMALLAMVIISSVRLNPNESTRILFNWASGLLALQGLCLVLFVPGRISNTIRADLTSKMIESHRLMPLPPAHAIAGYIGGGAGGPLVFAAGSFLLGGATAIAGKADWQNWLFAHVVLLMFAGFVWVLVSYIAFGAKLGAGILFLPLMIPYLSEGGVLSLFPGLMVLLSPVIGRSIFDLHNAGMTLPATYAIAFAAQIAVATICFIAASRKYRSSDSIGTDTVLGLCFVLVWVAASFAGMRAWEDFRPLGWSPMRLPLEAQVVGSMIVGMLVAMSPMAANAQERVRYRRHEALRDPAPIRKPWNLAMVLLIATAAIVLIPFAPPLVAEFKITPDRIARSAAIISLFLIGLYFLFDWCYTTIGRAAWAMFIWLLLTWGAPIAIDLVRYGLAESGEIEPMATVATCSPVGAMIVLWTDAEMGRVVNTTPGILAQCAIALVPLTLRLLRRTRRATGQ